MYIPVVNQGTDKMNKHPPPVSLSPELPMLFVFPCRSVLVLLDSLLPL